MSVAAGQHRRTGIIGLAARLGLIVTIGVLLINFGRFIERGIYALGFPYHLDYGEGIVWEQARLLFTDTAFGPIDVFPAIVYHYTPLFHAASRAVALTGIDMLYAGRLVSLVSTAAMAVLIGLIAARCASESTSRPARIAAGLIAGLALFSFEPVLRWSLLMRVDMLATALTLGGLFVGLNAYRTPWLIHVAALLFVAAIYSKQTMVMAPASLFAVMLWLRPRTALAGIATCTVLGLGVLGILSLLTDGGFVRHIFLYNINRMEWHRLWDAKSMMEHHAMFLVVTLAGVISAVMAIYARDRRIDLADNRAAACLLTILIYFVIAGLWLITYAKVGSNANYFIEWQSISAIFIGFAALVTARLAFDMPVPAKAGVARGLYALAVPALIVAQGLITQPYDLDIIWNPERKAALDALTARVAASDKPVVSDEMMVLVRAGKPIVWEPAIFADLAIKGTWDEAPFVERIRNREFAMFILARPLGEGISVKRYNPAVSAAIAEAYPKVKRTARLTIYLPDGPAQ